MNDEKALRDSLENFLIKRALESNGQRALADILSIFVDLLHEYHNLLQDRTKMYGKLSGQLADLKYRLLTE